MNQRDLGVKKVVFCVAENVPKTMENLLIGIVEF